MSQLPGVQEYGRGFRASVTVATPTYRTAEEAAAARQELRERLARVRLLRHRETHCVESEPAVR
jgi:hypothetical protein